MDAKGKDHGLLIHPDDIDFDLLTGEVIILGPKTPEEREMVQMAREAVQYSKTLLREACADLRKHPRRTSIQKRIDSLVGSIKFCNDMLPKRYQVDPRAVLDGEGAKRDEASSHDCSAAALFGQFCCRRKSFGRPASY